MGEGQSDKEVTKYWQRQTLKHLPEMRAAKAAGLFPTRDEYQQAAEKGIIPKKVKEKSFRNVVEHELVEAEACDILAEALGLPEDQREILRDAASLHDVKKREERELFEQEGPEGAKRSEEEQVAFLRNRGYRKKVVKLTQSVGGYSLVSFVEDPKASQLKLRDDIDLSALIIHYADDITLKGNLVPLRERIAYVKQKYKVEDEESRNIFAGRLSSDVQFEVSRQIEEIFAKKLGIDPPERLPEWIREKIAERIGQGKKGR